MEYIEELLPKHISVFWYRDGPPKLHRQFVAVMLSSEALLDPSTPKAGDIPPAFTKDNRKSSGETPSSRESKLLERSMAANGFDRGSVRDRLVNGIQSDGGREKDGFPGLPSNGPTRIRRRAHSRLSGEDGIDLVSGRKVEGERRG